jgi:hypothetical protein
MFKGKAIAILTMTAAAVCMATAATPPMSDERDPRGFAADLENCTELIGFGPVPLAAVAPLVPSGYTIVTFGPGTAGIVVRASGCQRITLDGSDSATVNVSQIGVAVVSPDGTGNINNYQLFYVTNDGRLAEALEHAGVPAQFDREIAYEFTADATGQSGEVYVAVSPPGAQAYFETGSVNVPPPNSGAPVIANWWFNGREGVAKITTSIASISYGTASLALHTSKSSLLGSMIGGNTDANFSFFNARGLFTSGHLDVSLQ